MTRLGFGLSSTLDDIENYLTAGKLAEEYGYETVWFAEDYFFRDAITTASVVGACTDEVEIGVFVNPFTRHPVLTAMSVASLYDIAGGSARIAMGAGSKDVMGRFVEYESPLWVVKESVEVVRAIFSGEESYQGDHFNLDGISMGTSDYLPFVDGFTLPSDPISIQIGAVGPQMLKMAGDIGDGVAISAGYPPELIEKAITRVEEGLAIRGRDRNEFDVSVFLLSAEEITPQIKAFAALTVSSESVRSLVSSGFEKHEVTRIKDTFQSSGLEAATEVVPDNIVKRLALIGTRNECHELINRYADVGVDEVNLYPLESRYLEQTLEIGASWSGP